MGGYRRPDVKEFHCLRLITFTTGCEGSPPFVAHPFHLVLVGLPWPLPAHANLAVVGGFALPWRAQGRMSQQDNLTSAVHPQNSSSEDLSVHQPRT
jgi:hypothetical protein